MPIQFSGVMAEHLWTRSSASLFDVGHMAILNFTNDSVASMQKITPRNLSGIRLNRCAYGVFTNSDGGIVDDFIATNLGTHFQIVSNASRKPEVITHLEAHDISFTERDDLTLLALQGPRSAAVLDELGVDVSGLLFMDSTTVTLAGIEAVISRSGYCGEDGFELAVSASNAVTIASTLLENTAVEMAGLGARDSLRIEAGLCLYGNDLDETTSPIEADLGWTVSKELTKDRSYLGSDRIAAELADGACRRLVGIVGLERKPIRPPATLSLNEKEVGIVTSGTFGPTSNVPVALAYVDAELTIGSKLKADVRGKIVPCELVELPFIKHNYHRS